MHFTKKTMVHPPLTGIQYYIAPSKHDGVPMYLPTVASPTPVYVHNGRYILTVMSSVHPSARDLANVTIRSHGFICRPSAVVRHRRGAYATTLHIERKADQMSMRQSTRKNAGVIVRFGKNTMHVWYTRGLNKSARKRAINNGLVLQRKFFARKLLKAGFPVRYHPAHPHPHSSVHVAVRSGDPAANVAGGAHAETPTGCPLPADDFQERFNDMHPLHPRYDPYRVDITHALI